MLRRDEAGLPHHHSGSNSGNEPPGLGAKRLPRGRFRPMPTLACRLPGARGAQRGLQLTWGELSGSRRWHPLQLPPCTVEERRSRSTSAEFVECRGLAPCVRPMSCRSIVCFRLPSNVHDVKVGKKPMTGVALVENSHNLSDLTAAVGFLKLRSFSPCEDPQNYKKNELWSFLTKTLLRALQQELIGPR